MNNDIVFQIPDLLVLTWYLKVIIQKMTKSISSSVKMQLMESTLEKPLTPE